MVDSIKRLPTNLVNQIAAGEVIERPASIIKELLENAIDAGAKNIDVILQSGGKNLIIVKDDGKGMSKADLALCLQAHTTSKLMEENLSNIKTLGFRGEALASITSIAKILVSSIEKSSPSGYEIYGENGVITDVKPSSIKLGTTIKVSDLFFSVPARLKFLRTDQVEANYCYAVIKRLALANPSVSIKVEHNDKQAFNFYAGKEGLKDRCKQILGANFVENSIFIQSENPKFNLHGFISLPTFHKNHANDQYFMVNGRSLKDKFLGSLVKIAYDNALVYGKYPSYALFLNIPEEEIDVNVNPTKSEVRFKDVSFIRHLIISTLKEKIGAQGIQNTSNTIADNLLRVSLNKNFSSNSFSPTQSNFVLKENNEYFKNMQLEETEQSSPIAFEPDNGIDYPLGYAKAQYLQNWIVAETKEGLIVVDQHAAHERITQEKLKAQYENKSVVKQMLLVPELLDLSTDDINILEIYQTNLFDLGISFDFFGKNVVLVKEVPAILGNPNCKLLMKEIIEDFKALESPQSFHKKINDITAKIACHGSIRSGRLMNIKEMNDLLREMEKTKNYAQCIHGRPTFIKISLKDLERFFGRS